MLHYDGFEQFAGDTSVNKALIRAGYIPTGQLTVTGGRANNSVGITAPVGARLERVHPWSGNKFSFGFASRFTSRGAMAWVKAGAEELIFWLDPDNGLPYLSASQGGALPIKNTWYYYELIFDRGAASVTLRINNRDEIVRGISPGFVAATALTAGMGHRPRADYMTHDTADASIKIYDDIYINTGDPKGPIIITTRWPETDVAAQWFNTDTGQSSAETVSGRPPEPNDHYIASNTMDAVNTWTSSHALANQNEVLGTGIVVLARKSPNFDAKLGVELGGTPGAGHRDAVRDVDSEWKMQYICFDQDGGDTPAGITAAPFGVKVRS